MRRKKGAAFRIWFRLWRCSAVPPLALLDGALPDDGTAFSHLERRSSEFLRRRVAGDAGAKVDKVWMRLWPRGWECGCLPR